MHRRKNNNKLSFNILGKQKILHQMKQKQDFFFFLKKDDSKNKRALKNKKKNDSRKQELNSKAGRSR